MTRIVKEKEYAVRRNAILDVAQLLVYTKGYEQMTIQDILDDLKISKGAFYHYFDSKQALLEPLLERMQQELEPLLIVLGQDSSLPALQKLQRFFAYSIAIKPHRRHFFSNCCGSGTRTTMPSSARKCVQLGSNGSRPGLRRSSVKAPRKGS